MHYNYEIYGQVNCKADCLSRRPEWLVGKDRTSDCDQDPIRGGAIDTSRNELCLRVITETRHFLRANPTISAVEEAEQKDPDYKMMIDFIRANKYFKELPPHSEG